MAPETQNLNSAVNNSACSSSLIVPPTASTAVSAASPNTVNGNLRSDKSHLMYKTLNNQPDENIPPATANETIKNDVTAVLHPQSSANIASASDSYGSPVKSRLSRKR